MDKREFLEKLAMALAGQVSRAVVEENLSYYDSYISGEVAKGIPLKEVLESLGDPRLIAKSIIDANGGGNDMAGVYQDGSYGSGQENNGTFVRGQGDSGNFKGFQISGFWAMFLLLAVMVCVLIIVGTLIGGIFLLIRPVLLPLLILLLIYHIIKGPRRY